MSDAGKIGRPSRYNPELGLAICERLMDGESLRSICRDPAMPSSSAVFRWLSSREEFREQYARAREIQAEALLDDVLEIADDSSQDWIVEPDGKRRVNHEMIQRAKLQVSARLWLISRMLPKIYCR